MNNYKIIADEAKLDEFIEWLPDLEESEGYYFQLFGRKKYLAKGELQSGQQSLSRFICKKERIKEKIRQLEIPLGRYVNRQVELPQECLCLYVCPNPRCHEKAAKQLLKVLADKITKKYEYYNTYQLAMTELHRACSRKVFIDFDFDDLDFEQLREKILTYVNPSAITGVKTRGGFHLLLRLDKIEEQYRKTWHRNISALGADVVGDSLLPVVGTTAGNDKCIEFVKL